MTTAALSASNTGKERCSELPSQTLVGGEVLDIYTYQCTHAEVV
jgi:hypothetical protein